MRATPIVNGSLDTIPPILKGPVYYNRGNLTHKLKYSNMGVYKLRVDKDATSTDIIYESNCTSLKRSMFVFNFLLRSDNKHLSRTCNDFA